MYVICNSRDVLSGPADGSILKIYEYDRGGAIWRKITCLNFFPSTPPTGLNENNYDSVGDAKTVSITFMVDDWVEEAVGMDKYRDGESGDIDENKYSPYEYKATESILSTIQTK